MKLPLLAVAAAGTLGLALAAPSDAQAGKVIVDVHFGIPVLPVRVVHAPPRRVIHVPVVVHPRHHHRHLRYARYQRTYYTPRGYAGDQWNHGYYDQRRHGGKSDHRGGHR